MELPGMGEPLESCSEVSGYISCPNGHIKIPLRNSCQRVDCPYCFEDWTRKAGHRISERLRGVRAAYKETRRSEFPKVRNFRHVMFSPPQSLLSETCTLDEAFKVFRRMYDDVRPLHGGCVVFHPYRLRDSVKRRLSAYLRERSEAEDDSFYEHGGFWALARADVLHLGSFDQYYTWGPHFHVLGFGFVPPSDVFHRETGWVYVNLKDRDNHIKTDAKTGRILDQVGSTARYLLTHGGIERGASGKYRNAYRWFGICGSRACKLVRSESGATFTRLLIDSVLRCPKCGAYLTSYTDCVTGDVILRREWLELLLDHGIGAVLLRKKYRAYEVINDV